MATIRAGRKKRFVGVPYLILVLCFVLLTIVFVYPFYNIYVYAFNQGVNSYAAPLYLYPRIPTLENFSMALKLPNVGSAFLVSISRVIAGTLSSITCTSLLAYAMSKRFLAFYKLFSTYFFITFLFGGGAIAYYLLLREIKLLNSFLVFIVPGLFGYWNMVIFRSFFDGIPASIEESAEIDGAAPFTIFFKLLVPMSKPVIAALSLFVAVNHWNDWYAGEYFVKNPALKPLQTRLQDMLSQLNVTNELSRMGALASDYVAKITPASVRMAVVVITVTPIIAIYPMLQKYFVKGITLGAVKG